MNRQLINTFLTAFYSLRVNRLRAIITIVIIALGITSLVGMQTAIDGLKWSLVSNLNTLGNNTFSITKDASPLQFGQRKRKSESININYREAQQFEKMFAGGGKVAISVNVANGIEARFKKIKTNPSINIVGGDEHYLQSGGYTLEAGRNFSPTEIQKGSNVAIIGRELNNLLFSPDFIGIGKSIYLSDRKFTVIGVTEVKGSSFGASFDKTAIIPINNARKSFANSINPNHSIKVTVNDVFNLENAVLEAIGTMRVIRKLKPGVENNFGLTKSESLKELLDQNMSYVSYAAMVIGLITLFGALIALMNIMFVTVTERTREIGTRMAVGASPRFIRIQFLSEATFISLVGGIVGIIFGLIIGNLVIIFLELNTIVPVQWIIISFVLCVLVGIGAGYLPAQKAAALDPIESLRYE